MGLLRKTPKPPRIRLSDLCYTSEADMERIINSAPVPEHLLPPPSKPKPGRQAK